MGRFYENLNMRVGVMGGIMEALSHEGWDRGRYYGNIMGWGDIMKTLTGADGEIYYGNINNDGGGGGRYYENLMGWGEYYQNINK
jgi:hypothetical protein